MDLVLNNKIVTTMSLKIKVKKQLFKRKAASKRVP